MTFLGAFGIGNQQPLHLLLPHYPLPQTGDLGQQHLNVLGKRSMLSMLSRISRHDLVKALISGFLASYLGRYGRVEALASALALQKYFKSLVD
ncbi:MAG: hypothetical protein ACFCVD_05020 [Nodosilinea sp.]